MGGGLKEGEKLTIIIQITGKKPETPAKDVKKFKDAVKKVAKANGATVLEV
jgi:predicted DNA-binding antitoxin AbrB/MazE fold protein